MQTVLYIIKILYKKRWWLAGISLLASVIVYILMSLQPKVYKSSTTIYTGIVSGYDVLSSTSGSQDWMSVNNAIDNLISIVKAESTLENVYMKLLARNLINLNLEEDNEFQTVKSSRYLAEQVPPEIFDLVIKDSEDQTFENLKTYYAKDRTNYLQQLFHWDDRHYSYKALSSVEVARIGNSDMISISYENDDQYIVFNTLQIIVKEFINQYISLRYEQTNEVVDYFETELERIRDDLSDKENRLTDYNTKNMIINYEEQTKQVAERSKGLDISIEEMSRQLSSAQNRKVLMEEKLGNVSQLYLNNAQFIDKLHSITNLYTENSKNKVDSIDNKEIGQRIANETRDLKDISNEISASKFSKEGIAAETLTAEWLEALLEESRAEAELKVLLQNRKELEREFERFSPVGSSLKRQNRDINFSEQNYLSNLQALNDARLRQKNLQQTSATFKTLSPPTVAVTPERTKTKLYTAITFILVMILLMVIEIIAELLNRKPYDRAAAEKILKLPALGAYPAAGDGKYDSICCDFARNQLGNAVVNFFDRTKTNNIINVLSLDKEEGKTTICNELKLYFDKLDTRPLFVSWNKDFDSDSKYYLMASSIYDFAVTEENSEDFTDAGVTIVEYPPLYTSSFPTKLLPSAALNILVVDSERMIKGMDHILLRQLKEAYKNVNLFVVLNGADKDSVGTFTGMLPPYNTSHRIRFAMWNLGNNSDTNG